jgi:hypothetical protein
MKEGDLSSQVDLGKDIEHQNLFALVELVGFFSKKHQGIFLHHGASLHLHMVSADGDVSGHVDDFQVSGPKNIEIFVGL